MNILVVSSLVLAVAYAAAMPEISKRLETSEMDTESLTLDRTRRKKPWKKKIACK